MTTAPQPGGSSASTEATPPGSTSAVTMTADARRTPPLAGSEAETLIGLLDYHRDTLKWKCAGLTDEQLRQPLHPTTMTLAGLVLHMAMVESGWFNLSFSGGIAMPGWFRAADPEDEDWCWSHAADFPSSQLWEWFDEAVAVSDGVVADVLADTRGMERVGLDPEEPVSMRWVLAHMIEEYARHNGHADLLRQAIDGATGD